MAKRKAISNKQKREMHINFKKRHINSTLDEIQEHKDGLKSSNHLILIVSIILGILAVIFFFIPFVFILQENFNGLVIFLLILGLIFAMICTFLISFYQKNNVIISFCNQELESKHFHMENKNNSNIYGFKHIKSLKYYSFEEVSKYGDLPFVKSGIYAFYCFDKYDEENDPIIPLYVGQSKDIWKRWKEHLNKIIKADNGDHSSEAKYQKICYYLQFKNLSIMNIKFCVLYETLDSELKQYESEWMKKTGSIYNGWNSVK